MEVGDNDLDQSREEAKNESFMQIENTEINVENIEMKSNPAEDTKEQIYKLKYNALFKRYNEINAKNKGMTEHIYQLGWIITRLQNRKLKLIKRLDRHGDDFRTAKRKFFLDKNDMPIAAMAKKQTIKTTKPKVKLQYPGTAVINQYKKENDLISFM